MEKIDLSTNSKQIKDTYDKVVRGDPNHTYVVYSVDKNSTLTLLTSGDGSLDEFVENFTDGQIQFGLARVTVPGSDVSKNILLGWCPDNSPAKSRLSFANNFADVSKVLNGYHVQITARDQDDLDVNEFLNRVGAAAGARYSTTSSSSSSSSKSAKPTTSKPIVSKSKPSSTPSFVPKSTGKPIPAKPAPPIGKKNVDKDGWGDEKDVEERDFDKKPLDNVPSAYKPTKVDIDQLRKGKSDTISSTPKSFKEKQETKNDDEHVKPLSERMKAYDQPNDGRMTSLPKPKVGHSVADKYKANAEAGKSSSSKPSFGSKPNFGTKDTGNKDKVLGGLSRNFGAENGKTPAQIWAEKRGKYKTVENDEEEKDESHTQTHASELAKKFEQTNIDDDDDESEPVKLPSRNIPPPPKQPEPESEEEEEEAPILKLPGRNLPPPPKQPEPESEEEDEDDEAPIPKLPTRNLPPPPKQPEPESEEEEEDEAPIPKLPTRSLPPAPVQIEKETPESKPKESKSITATAEYEYEKDEDNEIGFAEGELITEIEFTDDEWWTGKNKQGEVGLFPAAYVQLNESNSKDDTQPPASSEPSHFESQSQPKAEAQQKTSSKSATAEYDYEKDEDNEIGFNEGDLIIEIEFVDDDWWSGKHSKSGEVGLFPANYVSLNE